MKCWIVCKSDESGMPSTPVGIVFINKIKAIQYVDEKNSQVVDNNLCLQEGEIDQP